ncbi:flagellar basal body rod C-terminal domain-containing protein [Erythrobacter aurantius]
MLAESGVDLDTEAANLVRLQQAFDANSRVIQVATELFDTILGLG